MVKYYFFETRKQAEKKRKQINKKGYHATMFNFGKPTRKGKPWRVHQYKRKLPKELR